MKYIRFHVTNLTTQLINFNGKVRKQTINNRYDQVNVNTVTYPIPCITMEKSR